MVEVELGTDERDAVYDLTRVLKAIGLILFRSSHRDLFSHDEIETIEEALE